MNVNVPRSLSRKEDGTGYFVITLGNDIVETYEIKNIEFQKGLFTASFQNIEKKKELIKFEGTLFDENMLILREADKTPNDRSENMYFMRESVIPGLRNKAKQRVEQIMNDRT